MKYQKTKPLKLGPKTVSKYPNDHIITHKLKVVRLHGWQCNLPHHRAEPLWVDPETGNEYLLEKAYAIIRGKELTVSAYAFKDW